MKTTLAIIAIFYFGVFFAAPHAFAISEYGIRCEDNEDCAKCRDNITCGKCLHRCQNSYGSAEGSSTRKSNQDPDDLCQRNRSKWCHAQCWDPDDYKDPEYISTKPNCAKKAFWKKKKARGN